MPKEKQFYFYEPFVLLFVRSFVRSFLLVVFKRTKTKTSKQKIVFSKCVKKTSVAIVIVTEVNFNILK